MNKKYTDISQVADWVREIIVEQLGVNADEVTPEASFIDDLGADSLDAIELVMAFEEEFDIDIPDKEAMGMKTVGDAIEYIYQGGKKMDKEMYAVVNIGPRPGPYRFSVFHETLEEAQAEAVRICEKERAKVLVLKVVGRAEVKAQAVEWFDVG